MNITLIGSTNDIQAEYVEVDTIPEELLQAGINSLPIVLLNGNYYCHGYDLRALELLPYR